MPQQRSDHGLTMVTTCGVSDIWLMGPPPHPPSHKTAPMLSRRVLTIIVVYTKSCYTGSMEQQQQQQQQLTAASGTSKRAQGAPMQARCPGSSISRSG